MIPVALPFVEALLVFFFTGSYSIPMDILWHIQKDRSL
jgi:hypothetical protein